MAIFYENVWDIIITESKNSIIKRVAVSYLTDPDLISLNKGDQLIVDASPETIAKGSTCAKALDKLFKEGVLIYSLRNFHGKMYHFGKKVIIGSSNISNNSKSNLTEIIQASDEKDIIKESLNIFNNLKDTAIEVDRKLLHNLLSIKVNKKEDDISYESYTSDTLFVLEKVPTGKLLRAYFIALIELQIGELNTEKPFKLWKRAPNLETHILAKRINSISDDLYKLTIEGLEYFKSDEESPILSHYLAFTKALKTGNSNDLPEELSNKRLKVLN
ncbi:TPA: hypothetical protein VGT13_001477 [Shewanella algae]|nr:hypothetical protein [Shewanella algae]